MPATDEPLSILLRAFNLSRIERIGPEALEAVEKQSECRRRFLLHLC